MCEGIGEDGDDVTDESERPGEGIPSSVTSLRSCCACSIVF